MENRSDRGLAAVSSHKISGKQKAQEIGAAAEVVQSHKAPASFKRGTSVPLMWEAMTRSIPPKNFPPTNTAGTAWPPPTSLCRAFSMSLPWCSSSSSYTVGLTPRLQKRRLITWHMQHELMLKTTTAFSEASLSTLSSGDIEPDWPPACMCRDVLRPDGMSSPP